MKKRFDWHSFASNNAKTYEELKPTIETLEQMSAYDILEALCLPLFYVLKNASKEGPSVKSHWSHEKLIRECGEIESMLYEFSKNINQHHEGE